MFSMVMEVFGKEKNGLKKKKSNLVLGIEGIHEGKWFQNDLLKFWSFHFKKKMNEIWFDIF